MAEGGIPPLLAEGSELPTTGEEKEEIEVEPAGVIYKQEVAKHRQLIGEALNNFQKRIKEGEVKDEMKQLVEDLQAIIKNFHPAITETNIYHYLLL